MLVANTTLASKSLCCRTLLPFQGLEFQLQATTSVWLNRADRSGCRTLTLPQNALAVTDAGQAGLDLTQEPCKANKDHIVTGPHTGPRFSGGWAQTLLSLGDPTYLAEQGRIQIYPSSLGPPADRRIFRGTQNGCVSLCESPSGNACFNHSPSTCYGQGVGLEWGETGAKVYRKAQVTACVSMFEVL